MPRAGSAILLLLAAMPASPSEVTDPERTLASQGGAPVAGTEAQEPRPYVRALPTPMEIRVDGPGPATDIGCALARPASGRASARECLACHGGSVREHSSHPVDVDYEGSRGRLTGTLRPLREAVARGAFLPEGVVRCATCHDGRSRFRYRLAIPPGSEIRPSVRGHAPEGDGAPADAARLADLATVADGFAVRPLCLVCHPMD